MTSRKSKFQREGERSRCRDRIRGKEKKWSSRRKKNTSRAQRGGEEQRFKRKERNIGSKSDISRILNFSGKGSFTRGRHHRRYSCRLHKRKARGENQRERKGNLQRLRGIQERHLANGTSDGKSQTVLSLGNSRKITKAGGYSKKERTKVGEGKES